MWSPRQKAFNLPVRSGAHNLFLRSQTTSVLEPCLSEHLSDTVGLLLDMKGLNSTLKAGTIRERAAGWSSQTKRPAQQCAQRRRTSSGRPRDSRSPGSLLQTPPDIKVYENLSALRPVRGPVHRPGERRCIHGAMVSHTISLNGCLRNPAHHPRVNRAVVLDSRRCHPEGRWRGFAA